MAGKRGLPASRPFFVAPLSGLNGGGDAGAFAMPRLLLFRRFGGDRLNLDQKIGARQGCDLYR